MKSQQVNPSSYQLVPLTKLLTNGLNAVLVCDGVGVGKTIAAGHALTFLTQHCRSSGAVVCPTSLMDKWRFELKYKFGFDAHVLDSGEALDIASDAWLRGTHNPNRIYVVPFSLVARQSVNPFNGPIVIDEIHNLRNPETALFSGVSRWVNTAPYRIGLSATPVNNSLSDLAAELAVLLKTTFEAADVLIQDLWRKDHRHILYSVMTRFSKEKLGVHFLHRKIVDMHVDLSEVYWHEVAAIVKARHGRNISKEIFRDEITWMRLATSSPRAFMKSAGELSVVDNSKLEAAQKILNIHADELVLVFCDFEQTAHEIGESVADRQTFVITGSTPIAERPHVIDQFRRSGKGCLIMTSVGSEGLDVQFCRVLLNYDLTWNPMILEQRIGRIDRLGQSKSEVTIYNLIVNDSIDDRILRVLSKKLGLTEGSPLQPKGLLQSRSAGADSAWRDIISEEIKRARRIADALELAAQIIPNDYSVLDCIDTSYCNPAKLSQAGKTTEHPDWLAESEASKYWLESLRLDATRLTDTVRLYS